MKHPSTKRLFGSEQQVEEPDEKLNLSNHSNKEEQALDLKKVKMSEEFRLSHLPLQPSYDRPDCCNVSHRFGKKTGST